MSRCVLPVPMVVLILEVTSCGIARRMPVPLHARYVDRMLRPTLFYDSTLQIWRRVCTSPISTLVSLYFQSRKHFRIHIFTLFENPSKPPLTLSTFFFRDNVTLRPTPRKAILDPVRKWLHSALGYRHHCRQRRQRCFLGCYLRR
jgi:hypothetical protein